MSMHFISRLLTICLIASLALPSCVSKKKFNELQEKNNQLQSSLTESQNKVNMLEEKVASLESEMEAEKTRLNGEISSIRTELNSAKNDLANARRDLEAKQQELSNAKMTIKKAFGLSNDTLVENRDGNLYVKMEQPVNYRKGSASLNRESRRAVEQLATILKNNPDMHILIEGHADSDKYPRGAGYDNWSLSVDRAMAVVRRLIRLGVKPEQLSVAGRGDTAPMVPNDNRTNKAKNRRTEAKPSPKTGEIYQIGQ
jgi:chemotaxis protein MotB